MNIVLYGIPNCDTVKKARGWMAQHGVSYRFHDFKKDGLPADRLEAWIDQLGWENLINRKGTTWRKLDAATQKSIDHAAAAKALIQAQPSVIKRPIVEWPGQTSVGFDESAWALLTVR